jgi:aminoglycoside phosphotransferase (APT) family kinase protein
MYCLKIIFSLCLLIAIIIFCRHLKTINRQQKKMSSLKNEEDGFHPGLKSAEWSQITYKLNFNNLNQILNAIFYELISFQPFSLSDQKFINKIYLVKGVKKDLTKQTTEFVLKIINPQEFFGNRRAFYEALTLNSLKQLTNLPVPYVFDYSNDSATSRIGCEYILMEKLEGVRLAEILPTDPADLNERIYRQAIYIVKTLSILDVDKFSFIHRVDNYFQNLTKIFETIIQEFEKVAFDTDNFKNRIKNIYNELEITLFKYPNLNYLNFNDKKTIHHGDLNPNNILVDPKKNSIVGVLDWEFVSYGYDNKELDFIIDWFDKLQEEKVKHQINKLTHNATWYVKSKGKHVRAYLEELLSQCRLFLNCPKYLNDTNSSVESAYLKKYREFHGAKLSLYIEKWPKIQSDLLQLGAN